MPGSNMSMMSFASHPKSEMASQMARDAATTKITEMINSGRLDRSQSELIKKEWYNLYKVEYYKCYAEMALSSPQVQIVLVDHPASKKFLPKVRHAIGSFSKSNLFIHVNLNNIVSVSKFEYPLDSDRSLETKEAFLNFWPGPLDRYNDPKLKWEATKYIDKLLMHTKKRRIKYDRNDEQREVILKILLKLLHLDGSIDASSVTNLLLDSEQADIRGDERPLEMLQKYLLLGQRSEAIKYATEQRLWDLMLCLTFLDQYQPPPFTSSNQIDVNGLMIYSNTRYIDSMDDDRNILKMVYRSLLNNILKCDPRFIHEVKRLNVDNDPYRFAILSANDCDMEYDKTNEKFNLINAIKTAPHSTSNRHLISLGLTKQETNESRLHQEDELLDHSLMSLGDRQPDTYAKRTHIISNIDLLILNEIWELCYNLARGSNGMMNYQYNINLVPFKLVFAARLLDAGLYTMFASYLRSMKAALDQSISMSIYDDQRDSFYDWDAIVQSVKYLSDVWKVICESPLFSKYRTDDILDPVSPPTEPITFNPPPPAIFDSISQQPPLVPPPLISTSFKKLNLSGNHSDKLDSPNQSMPSPRQSQDSTVFSQFNHAPLPPMQRMSYGHGRGGVPNFSQPPAPIAEEFTDFNPDPDPYEQEQDHYQDEEQELESQEEQLHEQQQPQPPYQLQQQPPHQIQSPPQYQQPQRPQPPRQQQQPPLPQQPPSLSQSQHLLQNHRPPQSQQQQGQQPQQQQPQQQQQQQQQHQPQQQKQQQHQQQQQEHGLFASLAGRLLPKSNSKPMILPDDSNPSIVYDETRGTWTDTSKPDGEDTLDLSAPPPVQAVQPPAGGYSFPTRSTKSRYPRAQV